MIQNCKDVVCYNGGFCDPKTAQCECPEGFRGLKCENGKKWEKNLNNILILNYLIIALHKLSK